MLQAVVALTLLSSGPTVEKGRADATRYLRAETPQQTDNDTTEERGNTWAQLKNLFSGLRGGEESKIRNLASTFAKCKAKDLMGYDVYNIAINEFGYSLKKAVKYGYRYELYLKNPSRYSGCVIERVLSANKFNTGSPISGWWPHGAVRICAEALGSLSVLLRVCGRVGDQAFGGRGGVGVARPASRACREADPRPG
ncbi:hypothetical protein JG688_00013358 [Phytophthora aleatoria]|uniref:RxLR effector protein n=1 Tax=Phytophthora aleatoria TaxID=2496075 RepID=A0A8J5IHT3_9STRA|nr:hypothetical protein JG688_00013358 [Phytophthora aleatoria]